jgi:hypothetical protein
MAMMRGGAMNAGMVGVGGGSHTVMTSHGVMSSNTAVRVGGGGGDAAFDYDIHALLSLGALGPRLVATVIAHWDRLLAEDAPEARARHGALVAALFGRVTYALREWSGDAQLELPLEMIHAAQNPRITHDGIAVPFRWLLDVWGRGLAVVAGRFTLQAEAGGTSLLTVGAIGEPPRRMTITLE